MYKERKGQREEKWRKEKRCVPRGEEMKVRRTRLGAPPPLL